MFCPVELKFENITTYFLAYFLWCACYLEERSADFQPQSARARKARAALHAPRAAMALSKLSGDEAGVVFIQLCNVLEPRLVYLSGASNELWATTQAMRQQLRADHEVAAALCLKMGLRSCKELREAKQVVWINRGLSTADMATLGTLGSVLPALETLVLSQSSAGPGGVQRLAEGLGAGALPAVTQLKLFGMHVGDAGASALAAALGLGALPRLKHLELTRAAIGDAGLVALAPALQRLPALERLHISHNSFGDEGLAALLAPPPPPPTGAPPPPAGVLTKLKTLNPNNTQISDAGCAALAAALDSGSLPALEVLNLVGISASAAAQDAVREARAFRAIFAHSYGESDHEEWGSESEQDEEGEDEDEEGEEDE
eukprot:scaffold126798_cov51-Phaeocystis_antarctica.AAC.1